MAVAIELGNIAAGVGGFVILGQDPGDRSSFSVASAGDVNGDGFGDLIVGAQLGDAAGNLKSNAGDSYVVFGKAGGFGASVDLTDIAAGIGGFALYGERASDYAGISVASAGDVNGDGFDDLIIAATGAEADPATIYQQANAGKTYVVFGKASGFGASVDLTAIASGDGGFAVHGFDPYDNFGSQVASAGDMNGDGFDDLVIGSWGGDALNNFRPNAGEVFVVFGKAGDFGGTIRAIHIAAGIGGFVINGQDDFDRAGNSVASAGDLNGDGFDDIVIGAYSGDGAGNLLADAGNAYVVFGKAGAFDASMDLATVAQGIGGFVINGRDTGDHVGTQVASAGDINGDGFSDLIVGAYRGAGAGNSRYNAGESYVVFGTAGGFGAVVDLAAIASGNGGFVIYGQDASDFSGYSVAGAGDVNGDGFDDLIVGAFGGDATGNNRSGAGDSYVIFGKAGGFGASIDLGTIAAGTGGFVIAGQDNDDNSGTSVAPAGDVDGDGFDDLIIGAVVGDAAGNNKIDAGESYVIFGGDFATSLTHPGSNAADNLVGTLGADQLVGGLGNDTLGGGDSDDALRGGAGNDILAGGAGADRLNGGSGSDTADYTTSLTAVSVNLARNLNSGGDAAGDKIAEVENVTGSANHDTLVGNTLANVLSGLAGNDTIDGGIGSDDLSGGTGFDSLGGGLGNDTLRGGENADTLRGGDGNDLLNAGKGTDSLDGGAGNDTLIGALGTDVLIGGDGIDTADYSGSTDGVVISLLLTSAQQVSIATGLDTLLQIENLIGSALNDNLTGTTGNNTLTGGLGHDTLNGDTGFDLLDGGDGNNSLAGGLNADTVIGGAGNDFVGGGQGTDSLVGSDGDDTLVGGLGTDRLVGGAGADHYVFRHVLDGTNNIDTFADLESGVDVVELSASIFTSLAPLLGTKVGANANLVYNAGTGVLGYDADGAGAGAPVTFAIVGTSTHPATLGQDFLVVA